MFAMYVMPKPLLTDGLDLGAKDPMRHLVNRAIHKGNARCAET